ncbi:MAG: hypothetical protein C5B50_02020 [Verrucomicrobia bacterium]|nr:MAG: hypothetical protein C5B50_02020 [Verrucomicrobiota bacterium]
MKQLGFVVIMVVLSRAITASAESSGKPLKDMPLSLQNLKISQTNTYKWASVVQKDGKKESTDYAVLVVSSTPQGSNLFLHDTITLVRSYGGTVFKRSLKYPKKDLLRPEQISLDIIGEGKSVREMTYENGEMKIFESPGKARTEHLGFEDGVLTFNAMLRVVPLLPRQIGSSYKFKLYAEPFLFRIREATQKDPEWTLTCAAMENVTIGRKTHECVRYRLDLKSVEVRTDIWVGKNNLVVKFVDYMPGGASAGLLEATLQE